MQPQLPDVRRGGNVRTELGTSDTDFPEIRFEPPASYGSGVGLVCRFGHKGLFFKPNHFILAERRTSEDEWISSACFPVLSLIVRAT